MNPERWTRLQQIFGDAVERPVSERASFLAAACGSDEELRREVEEMLAFDAGSEEVLRHAIGGAVTNAVHGEQNRLIGTVIGSYRIKGVLGYGGMGTVYDAERADDQFRQRVAIKLVQQMAVHPQLRARLRAERQILANLDHPYIARLIDGGETANGTPYLVIEYVDGVSIDEYCDKRNLGVHPRLELFEKVCAAVDYAHRNLVVHRDLKPANILVTADGTPKLLDFGIAKLLNPDPAWATLAAVTRVQDRLLTPEHASPEQVLGRTITTASDVYALGVLLYELLCGRSPYALKNSTPLALERAICNEDPPRPSSLFRQVRERAQPADDGFDPPAVAQLRGVGHQRLARQLAGDIDEVVLKAMRKEPEQRYATAGQLAEELRRHRSGEAVVARQGVRRYRLAKFVRRNALSVAMVSTVIVALATFATFMWLKTQELAEQRDLVVEEKEAAEQVSAFLTETFGSSDPFRTEGREVTARELLDRGAEEIARKPLQRPETRARMFESIGYAFHRQGVNQKAVPLLEQALRIRRQINAPPEMIAANLLNLGDAERGMGNRATAGACYEEALGLYVRLYGRRHESVADVLVSQARLALENNGQLGFAKSRFTEALSIYQEVLGPENLEVGSTLSDLAGLAIWQDDLDAAEKYQKEALRIYKAQGLERTHPDHASALGALGQIYLRRGNLEEADKLISQALEAQIVAFGRDSSKVADLLETQGRVREGQKRYAEAINLVQQALDTLRRINKGKLFTAGYYEDSLAFLKFKVGRNEEAETHVRAALSIYSQTLPANHLYIASSQYLLGELLLARGDAAGAAEALRVSITICNESPDAGKWRAARSQSALGEALSRLGQDGEAERLLVESHRALLQDRKADDEYTKSARERLLGFLRARHRERDAARLLAPAPS